MFGVGKSGLSEDWGAGTFWGANATDAGVGVPEGMSRSKGPVPGELNAAAMDDDVSVLIVGNGYEPDRPDDELAPLPALRIAGRIRGGEEGLAVDLADVRDDGASCGSGGEFEGKIDWSSRLFFRDGFCDLITALPES